MHACHDYVAVTLSQSSPSRVSVGFLGLILGAGVLPLRGYADQIGNGGGGVVCRDGEGLVKSVETLDVYEARQRGLELDLGDPGQTFDEKLNLALSRLRRLSPRRAQVYADEARRFLSTARFLDDSHLERIPDSDPIALPHSCGLEQVVARKPPLFPTDAEYLVDNSLWRKLDVGNQVAMTLHEVIYREAVDEGKQRGSAPSRLFNSFLFTRHWDNVSLWEYTKFIGETMNFQWTDIKGYHLRVSLDEKGKLQSPTFHLENGAFRGGQLLSPAKVALPEPRVTVELADKRYPSSGYGAIAFHPSGELFGVSGRWGGIAGFKQVTLDGSRFAQICGQGSDGYGTITYHPNGKLKSFRAHAPLEVKRRGAPPWVEREGIRDIVLDDQGFLVKSWTPKSAFPRPIPEVFDCPDLEEAPSEERHLLIDSSRH